MTCEYFEINPDDALYNLARRYPGSIEALALRLGRAPMVLRKQLMPGTATHHLSPDDFMTIIQICAAANVPGAYQPLHALCFSLDHIAVRLPVFDTDADGLFAQVLLMLREEGALASNIQKALANDGRIDRRELAEIEDHLEQCISALATLREQVRAKHRRDFTKGAKP